MPKNVTKTKKVGKRRTKIKKVRRPKKITKKPVKKVERLIGKQLPTARTQQRAGRAVRYFGAVGRRKTAVARVRLWAKGRSEILVNEKPLEVYFPILELQQIALASLNKMKCLDKFKVQVKVKGGGLCAQAEAIRHGIARALVLFNADFRKRLKKAGFLTRDSRMRERKKFGLKRARRAPQWRKR